MELNKNCKNYIVSHSNDLVQSKYNLSVNAQKLLFLVASHIQPQDSNFCEIKFNVAELAVVLDVSKPNLYKELPKVTAELVSKLIQFKYTDNKGRDGYLQGTFLSTAEYKKHEGIVILEFSPKVAPYLLQLNGLFTQYKLRNILKFNSKYSIRLYQIFKSELFKGSTMISVEDFKSTLCLNQKAYAVYGNLKTKVIDPAISEINKNTDIKVVLDEKKEGRRVVFLKFIIKSQKNKNIDNLGNEQLAIDEIIDSTSKSDFSSEVLKFMPQLENIKIKISPKTLQNNYDIYGEDIFKRACNILINNASEGKIKKPVSYFTKILENLKNQANNEIAVTSTPTKKPSKFANFTQREYDYNELEWQLLGWDKD